MCSRSLRVLLSLFLALSLSWPTCSLAGPEEPSKENIQPALSSQSVARLHRWRRDLVCIGEELRRKGPKALQNTENVELYQQRLARIRDQVESLATPDDGEVLQTLALLTETMDVLATMRAEALQQLDELGDYQQQLALIGETIASLSVMPDLQWPFSSEQAVEFASEIAARKDLAQEVLAELQAIRKKAFLPVQGRVVDGKKVYGRQDVDRFAYLAGRKMQSDLHGLLLRKEHEIIHAVGQQVDTLAWYNDLDPEKTTDQHNYFLSRGARERALKMFAAKLDMLVAADTLYNALQQDPPIDLKTMIKAVENTRHGYEIKYQYALDIARMPSSINNAAGLEAIARDTLAKKISGEHMVKRLVVVSPLTRLEKTGGDPDLKEWDQFKVVSAEQVGDGCYLYYNTLKIYRKGGPETPLDQWIISDRAEHSIILLANVSK